MRRMCEISNKNMLMSQRKFLGIEKKMIRSRISEEIKMFSKYKEFVKK